MHYVIILEHIIIDNHYARIRGDDRQQKCFGNFTQKLPLIMRDWCNGNTPPFQGGFDGSSPLSRSNNMLRYPRGEGNRLITHHCGLAQW